MNKQNRRRPMLALSGVLILLITAVSPLAVVSAENEPPAQQPEPTVQKPADTSVKAATDPGTTPKAGQPAPAAAVTPIKQFEPSEKIGADSAVAFPIDI